MNTRLFMSWMYFVRAVDELTSFVTVTSSKSNEQWINCVVVSSEETVHATLTGVQSLTRVISLNGYHNTTTPL